MKLIDKINKRLTKIDNLERERRILDSKLKRLYLKDKYDRLALASFRARNKEVAKLMDQGYGYIEASFQVRFKDSIQMLAQCRNSILKRIRK